MPGIPRAPGGRVTEEEKEEIKRRLDVTDPAMAAWIGLADVDRRGNKTTARCPNHNDQGDPNLTLHPPGFRYDIVAKCFNCGFSADIFGLYERIHNCDFGEAAGTLADRAGVMLARDEVPRPASRVRRGPRPVELRMTSAPPIGSVAPARPADRASEPDGDADEGVDEHDDGVDAWGVGAPGAAADGSVSTGRVAPPRTALTDLQREALEEVCLPHWRRALAEDPIARGYLASRGIDRRIIEARGIGYARQQPLRSGEDLRAAFARRYPDPGRLEAALGAMAEVGVFYRDGRTERYASHWYRDDEGKPVAKTHMPRIIMPDFEGGRVRDIMTRVVGDIPKHKGRKDLPQKYLNLKLISPMIFGYDAAMAAPPDAIVILVEGPFDVMAAEMLGFVGCAYRTSRPTPVQAGEVSDILMSHRAAIVHDDDAAGRRGVEEFTGRLGEQSIVPEGRYPATTPCPGANDLGELVKAHARAGTLAAAHALLCGAVVRAFAARGEDVRPYLPPLPAVA
jgi:hypothetical protein